MWDTPSGCDTTTSLDGLFICIPRHTIDVTAGHHKTPAKGYFGEVHNTGAEIFETLTVNSVEWAADPVCDSPDH